MKHEQHRQGHGGQSNPASNQTATQPGDPGAAPPKLANTSGAAPGTSCPSCGHAMSMNMCWRLTCPSRGAGISAKLVRDRVVYDRAVAACSNAARMVMRSSLFDPEPPEKAYAFVFDGDDDD